MAKEIEAKLLQLGLTLPEPPKLPPGMTLSFAWVRARGNHLYLSGHGQLEANGTPAGPFGKVPSEVPLETTQQLARHTALAMLSTIKRELGDLDRVTAWLIVNGAVNADPGYSQTTLVLNGFSDLVIELYGPDVGLHARTAFDVAALPLNLPVIVSAEVEFA